MCLVKKHKLPRFSFRPIVCYKVLVVVLTVDDFKPHYVTPYQLLRVELNSYIVAKDKWSKNIGHNVIFGEGVHAYRNFEDVVHKFSDDIVVKAIIPPFTFYWESIGGTEIAATKMYITDEIVDC